MQTPLFQSDRPLRETYPSVTLILVNYQSWPDIERLVATLRREPEFGSGQFEIVVVDNASDGPVPSSIAHAPAPGVRLVLREENGGFAVGVNAGWRLARGPWLLVLNPDVEIERGWIGQVLGRIQRLSVHPDGPPGIVGFGLWNPDGSIQGSVGVFPSLPRTIREQFIPRPRRKYQAVWRIREGSVDWVTGACMLLNARMMADLGGMDEDFFLYHEEVALSRSAHDRGWRVDFDPTLHAVHRHPLQNRAVSPKMRVIIRHSKLLYFRKHLPGWHFLGLSRLIDLEAAIRGTWAAMRGNRRERRAWTLIAELSRRFRAGDEVRGREVLALAEEVESGDGTWPRRMGSPHRGQDRTHHPEPGGRPIAVPPGPAEDAAG